MSINQKLKENVELAPLTTFKIGGKARYFIEAESAEEIIAALKFADENKFGVFILGGGSNILISDEGFDGLVLQIANKGISVKESDDSVLVTAKAGEDWDEFVEFCVQRELAGLECLSGIPGLVGGTPIQNVGAYGQEVSETITNVKVYDRKTKNILDLSNEECNFEYRTSIFNSTDKDRFTVLAVTYRLKKNGEPKITYADLLNHFTTAKPNLREVREAVKKIRASKGMLVRQGGLDSQSAGSFFKNPVVSNEKFAEIERIADERNLLGQNEIVPSYKAGENLIKIPAAWLIERAGFSKGYTNGNAGLSTLHTLALTNRGDAKASDIIKLKKEIEKKVKEIFGIELQTEPNFIGFNF